MASPTDLRDGLAGLAVYADHDLRGLWAAVSSAVEARDALKEVLPELTRTYGLAAAALAADWYEELRLERTRSRFTPVLPDLDGDLGAEALAGWAVSPLFRAEPDWLAARSQLAGGLQRRIANAGRQTVMLSSVADPDARGWRRAGGGDCEFCQMLIGRGAVYSEATADFESHDRCNCVAVPAF